MPKASPNPLAVLEEAHSPYPLLPALLTGADEGVYWAWLGFRNVAGQLASLLAAGVWDHEQGPPKMKSESKSPLRPVGAILGS